MSIYELDLLSFPTVRLDQPNLNFRPSLRVPFVRISFEPIRVCLSFESI